jgi:hypothetical protein
MVLREIGSTACMILPRALHIFYYRFFTQQTCPLFTASDTTPLDLKSTGARVEPAPNRFAFSIETKLAKAKLVVAKLAS